MNAAVSVGYLLLVTPTIVEAANDGDWAAIALMGALAVVLLFRRDHPVTVVGVVAVLEVAITMLHPWGANVSAGLWFALFALAVSKTRRFSLTALALATTPLAMVYFLMLVGPLERSNLTNEGVSPDSQQVFSIVAGITITLSNVIATGIGISVRQRREHEQEIAAWASRAAMLGSVTERNRIAREMHDVVAHSLTVMVTLSDGAAIVMKKSPERAAEVLGELSRNGRTALADMRRVLGVLRNDDAIGETQAPREPLATGAGLGKLLEGFRTAGLPLHHTHTGPALPTDAAFQLTVYRIVQESLTNVLRYGRSLSRVELNIIRDGPTVTIDVFDDGRHTAAPAHAAGQPGTGQTGTGLPGAGQPVTAQIGSGQGIQGMRERAGIYAGTVEAGPAANGGWRVRAVLDLNGTT
jgi:signal transduction histidine kinase